MKRLALVLLVAGAAWAQFVPPTSSSSGTLTPSGITTPFVDAGTVNGQIGNFSFVDGGVGTFATVNADTAVLNTNVKFNTGSAAGSGCSIYASSPSILQFATNGQAAWGISGGNKDWVPANAGSSVCSSGAGKCNFYGANLDQNGRLAPGAQPVDGGTAQPYIEYGNVTCSSSRCPVTFRNAFSVGPRCVCTMVTDGGCNLEGPASTTGVAFHAGPATAVVDWLCVGDR